MKSLKGNIGEERGGAMLATKKGSEKWARKKTFPFYFQREKKGEKALWRLGEGGRKRKGGSG